MYLSKEEALHQVQIAMNRAVLNGSKVMVGYDAINRIVSELHEQQNTIRNLTEENESLEREIELQ